MYDSTAKYQSLSYKGNIHTYKKHMDSIYNEQVIFLNQYVKKYGITSESFISTVKLDLKYEHLSALLIPGPNELISIIQEESQSTEKLFDFKSYLGNINVNDFKDENQLNLLSFRTTLFPLISNYFDSSGHPPYTKKKAFSRKRVYRQQL